MAFLDFHVLLFLLAGIASAQVSPLSSISLQSGRSVVPNRFVVEFSSTSSEGGPGESQSHELFYSSLAKQNVPFQVDREFDSAGVFTGVAVTLNDDEDVDAVANTPGVAAVRPVMLIKAITPVSMQVIDANIAKQPLDMESTHIMTGVDKLHAEGVTGKGIKIGIIDTGIDYTHPLLGGGFGPGRKVVGGYDFVGNAYNGSNTPRPGPNPLDQCNGHGTHVAGIIGANPKNKWNISGVAYDAQLYSYRVFGCSGFVTDDIIIAALLRGLKDGNDILTLSIGGADGWTESSSAVVASRIAGLGKVVTIAAGNDGSSGAWYSSSPGNSINAMSIASVENTVIPVQQATVSGVQHGPIVYSSLFPLPVNGALQIYATSKDTTILDDACDSLPASTPNLSSYLVIIRRGTCTFVQKLANVAAKGAKVALIYDNGNGFSYISAGNYTAAMIQASDGEFLVKQFVAGARVTITFPQTGAAVNFPSPMGGLVSSFSSYGPSDDFFFKPAVAAPGGNILSTLPVPLGSFGVLSGTSMATPFAAGSSALLLQVKGRQAAVALSARSLFETTAKVVSSSNKVSSSPLQTVAQQGAGLIQVYNALRYSTVVTPGELVLNDTAHFRGTHTITVTNTGRSVKTYKVKHVPAGTAITVQLRSIQSNPGPVPLTNQYASVKFSRSSFKLSPGSTIKFDATVSPPRGINPTTFPVYSGFIQIEDGTETLHVSYIGLAASLINRNVLDTSNAYFGFQLPAMLSPSGQVQTGPATYTFTKGNVPKIIFRLVFGTPLLRIDLVAPTFKPQSSLGSAMVPIIGSIAEFDYLSRNNVDPEDNAYDTFTLLKPAFANGTAIQKGSYRLFMRALRASGNPAHQSDYDTWLSPRFSIVV